MQARTHGATFATRRACGAGVLTDHRADRVGEPTAVTACWDMSKFRNAPAALQRQALRAAQQPALNLRRERIAAMSRVVAS